MAMKITRNSLLCSLTGGLLEMINADGETVGTVVVPPGNIPARRFFGQMPRGGEMRPSELEVYNPPSAIQISRHPQMFECGANPDYQPPSNAQKLEEQMRAMLRQASKAAKRIEARAAAFERMERIKPAPEPVEAAEPVEVIEKEAKSE